MQPNFYLPPVFVFLLTNMQRHNGLVSANVFDVHSYTSVLQKYVEPIAFMISGETAPSEDDFARAFAKLDAACPIKTNNSSSSSSPSCSCKLALQALRHQSVYDPQLKPTSLHNTIGLLLDLRLLLFRCTQYAESSGEMNTLHETLCEIGGTCVQGQSHRLMYLYLAWHNML